MDSPLAAGSTLTGVTDPSDLDGRPEVVREGGNKLFAQRVIDDKSIQVFVSNTGPPRAVYGRCGIKEVILRSTFVFRVP
jgi:hypothetical protein